MKMTAKKRKPGAVLLRWLTRDDWYDIFYAVNALEYCGVRVSQVYLGILFGLHNRDNQPAYIGDSEELFGHFLNPARYQGVNALLRRAELPFRLAFYPPERQVVGRPWRARQVRIYAV